MSARRICSAPGCGTVVERGRCPAHEVKQNDRRQKDPEQVRAIVRAQEPMCRICTAMPSTNVDHIDGDWRCPFCGIEHTDNSCGGAQQWRRQPQLFL